jgi:predicted phage terminase large subunit-like protein
MDVAPVTLCEMESGLPVNVKHGVRMWDLAATAKQKAKRDPDFTSGTLMARDTGTGKRDANGILDRGTGKIWILDQIAAQLDPEQVQELILQTARLDGPAVKVRMETEPGASGKSMVEAYRALLVGFDFDGLPHSGDKMAFADPWASQVNSGNVYLLKAAWNKPYIVEHAAFPNGQHDDRVDSSAGALIVTVGLERRFRKVQFVKV